jgi:hypothetical protein
LVWISFFVRIFVVNFCRLPGTSLPITVTSSNTTDCLQTFNQPPHFGWSVSANQQCGTATISIDSTLPNTLAPPPHCWVVYPGGQSFAIDIPSVVPGGITTFTSLIKLRGGSQMIRVWGDADSAISSTGPLRTIANSDDTSCLDASTPSLTPAPAAGQVVMTTSMATITTAGVATGTAGKMTGR